MKRKASPTLHYTVILAVVFLLLFTSSMLLSRPFLQNFYESRKIKAMKNAYRQIEEAFADDSYGTDGFEAQFRSICERNSVDIVVIDYETQTLLASGRDYEEMNARLLAYVFDRSKTEGDVLLEQKDGYELRIVRETDREADYIDMWGVMKNGNLFLIRAPLEGIREAVRIAGTFLNYIILILAVLLFLVGLLYYRKLKYQELQETNERLLTDIKRREELENMRTEFLSNVSHELKTPIALIQGYAEGLSESVNDDEESRQYYCEVIADEASKMNGIVQELLELNSIEFGERHVEITDFDVTELIRDYLSDASLLCRQKNITLETEDTGPLYIRSDKAGIEEVFNNYFTNALHYVSENGRIAVRFERGEKTTRVSVFNTGDQIPEESLPLIWDKFYKIDKARTRAYGGSGVGLSIVKAIMDTVQGAYGVINCKDGVEFYFETENGTETV